MEEVDSGDSNKNGTGTVPATGKRDDRRGSRMRMIRGKKPDSAYDGLSKEERAEVRRLAKLVRAKIAADKAGKTSDSIPSDSMSDEVRAEILRAMEEAERIFDHPKALKSEAGDEEQASIMKSSAAAGRFQLNFYGKTNIRMS
jgi:hypothetical protein